MKVVVSGSTGFIGSSLIPALRSKGWEVFPLTRADSTTTESVIEFFKLKKPDLVIHLASFFKAEHLAADISEMVRSNVEFGTQILEGMKESGCTKILNTSTFWQHFEDADYDPVCLYAASKQAFEAIIQFYVNAHGFQCLTLSLSDTYGPNDPRRKVMRLLKEQFGAEKPLAMSSGLQKLDLLHIRDVVAGYLVAIDQLMHWPKGAKKIGYGLSQGTPISLRDLAAVFEKVAAKSLPITWGGRPHRAREVMQPWSKVPVLPGWSPKVSLEQGIREYLDV